MTSICNIRWGNDRGKGPSDPCGGMNVIEVMARDNRRRSEFATVCWRHGKATMYLSPVSLFDIFDCIRCGCTDPWAEKEKAESIAKAVIPWDEDENKLMRILSMDSYDDMDLMRAADITMQMYLRAPWHDPDPDAVDAWMQTFKKNCQCESPDQCRREIMRLRPEPLGCAHCHKACEGSVHREDRPAPPTEI